MELSKKTETIVKYLKEAIEHYPTESSVGIMQDSLEIIYGTRDEDNTFHCIDISWKRIDNKWKVKFLPIEKYSYQLHITESGGEEFRKQYEAYISTQNFRTSRAMFQTFCDTLKNIKEKHCGGAPQLVGIYSKPNSPARNYGIIYKKHRYISGMLVDASRRLNLDIIEWRNELFEICDPKTMKRKEGAQPQPYP